MSSLAQAVYGSMTHTRQREVFAPCPRCSTESPTNPTGQLWCRGCNELFHPDFAAMVEQLPVVSE